MTTSVWRTTADHRNGPAEVSYRDRERVEFEEPGQGGDGGWTVGYLDVLLVLVTLFAALLAAAYLQIDELKEQFAKVEGEPEAAYQQTLVDPVMPVAFPGIPALEAMPVWLEESAPPPISSASHLAPELLTQTLPALAAVEEAPIVRIESVPAPILLEPVEPLRMPPELEALASLVASQGAEQSLELIIEDHQVRLEVGNDILFPSGAAQLSAAGLDLLAEVYQVLAQEPLSIIVEGHTDNVPINTERFPSNWELSSLRATTVARQLIELGIPAEQLRVAGHAHTRPRVANDTPENRALNRRVSLVLEVPQ
ncbi:MULTISPECIES: OmpA family protein [unclassified Ectothiorhodospira]|uniref:OmpA/MotB family protein n=1 Tax=unclassified Ectothiorhodospira TaxID=2684909 RepID=UPI001EE92E76|nr:MULTISPECIES: OmpA family protein [unclassified Ectothiorhodospira]MCG5516207.1 OmpA family protein [Ectothiorhodospira sp. 9100]MCG5519640.1 OmpA family protein [Ectothiorhodospira sp. 9905]